VSESKFACLNFSSCLKRLYRLPVCSKNDLALSNQIGFLRFHLKGQRLVPTASTNRANNTANESPSSKQINCDLKVKSAVWRGMTPCNVIDNYQRLGESAAFFFFLEDGGNMFLREQQSSNRLRYMTS
jgi:hypothetical protein